MPIEMPKGLPFSVDTWTPNSGRKRHHFLTHAHRDHLQGLPARPFYPIYATRVTKVLTLRHLPRINEDVFVDIEVGKTVLIRDPEGDFSVTAFDANHCAGGIMFLFEGSFGNLLHTGDCRLSPDCIQKLPLKYIAKKGSDACLDYLFLDCTFGRIKIDMPTKESAIQQVISCIWKHPNAPRVYLACDLLGQEDILVEVSKAFGSKIYVDKHRCAECFHALSLIAPGILSEDASSRFQVFEGFPRLYERASAKIAQARSGILPEPLFIRPSAQWYACEGSSDTQGRTPNLSEAVKDEHGVWHVCYSIHSSRDELECALQLLRPKWVISTTPPCRAMELPYVKDHCFKTRVNADDPIWKLFGAGAEKFATGPTAVSLMPAVALPASSISSAVVEEETAATDRGCGAHLSMAPRTERSLTLFGRSRLGAQDLSSSPGKNTVRPAAAGTETPPSASSPRGGVIRMKPAHLQVAGTVSDKASSSQEKDVSDLLSHDDEEFEAERRRSSAGSPGVYNDSLRKFYRAMNVPVPKPLPSLAALMETSNKRARVRS